MWLNLFGGTYGLWLQSSRSKYGEDLYVEELPDHLYCLCGKLEEECLHSSSCAEYSRKYGPEATMARTEKRGQKMRHKFDAQLSLF